MATRKTKKSRRRRARRLLLLLLFIILAIAIVLMILAVLNSKGFFYKKAEVSTIVVNSDGSIIAEEISKTEGLSQGKDDIKKYVEDSVAAFNKKAGTEKVRVEAVDFNEKEGEAYVRTRYTDSESFQGYTQYDYFSGTVAQAQTRGYDFGTTFYPVENGIAGTPVTREELNDASILKVVIINDPTNIRVNGKIRYLSTENTRLVSDRESGVMTEDINHNDVVPYIYVIYEEGKK